MENTDKAIAAMLDKFQQFVDAYGAEAVDAALFGVRIYPPGRPRCQLT